MFIFLGDRKDSSIGIQAIICCLLSPLSEADSKSKEFTFRQALGKILRTWGFKHLLNNPLREIQQENTPTAWQPLKANRNYILCTYKASCLPCFGSWGKFYTTKSFVHDLCKVTQCGYLSYMQEMAGKYDAVFPRQFLIINPSFTTRKCNDGHVCIGCNFLKAGG